MKKFKEYFEDVPIDLAKAQDPSKVLVRVIKQNSGSNTIENFAEYSKDDTLKTFVAAWNKKNPNEMIHTIQPAITTKKLGELLIAEDFKYIELVIVLDKNPSADGKLGGVLSLNPTKPKLVQKAPEVASKPGEKPPVDYQKNIDKNIKKIGNA